MLPVSKPSPVTSFFCLFSTFHFYPPLSQHSSRLCVHFVHNPLCPRLPNYSLLQLMGLSGNKDAAVPHLLNYPFLLVTYRSICLVVTMLLAHWFGRIIHVPCLRWNKLTSCFTLAWRELVVMHNSCPRGLLSATLGPGWEWGQVFTGDINISSSGQWLSLSLSLSR